VTPGTAFDIGSLARQFTAAAVLRLEAARLLTVGDSLRRFFPDVPGDKAAITIHQLLTHTSGLTPDPGLLADAGSRDEAVRRIFASRLRTRPGERYVASAAGYTLLAALVERVSGRPFPEFVRGEFLDRAGMAATGFAGDSLWRSRPVATGYLNGTPHDPAAGPPGWDRLGNGGMLSTADDLHRWVRELVEWRVVSAGQLEQMLAPLVTVDDGSWFGYGWSQMDSPLGQRLGHHAVGPGGNADLAYFPGQDLLLVALSGAAEVRSWLGLLPTRVSLPATELVCGLAAGMASGELGDLPRTTFRSRPVLVWVGMLGAALVLLVAVVRSRRRRR
jgi:CubicO group peptidase (beta-lactamase class C family)